MQKKSFKDGVQFAFDSTSIELAQTCPRKYYYQMIRGVAPKGKSVHLLFGGIYADALQHFYLRRFEGASVEDAMRQTVRLALTASWDREAGHPIAFNDTKKTRPNLIRTIVWYIEQFGEETEDGLQTYQLANGKPAVELSFAFEVTDDIMFCGHLDRVVSMGDQLYVMDQKTSGGTVGTYYFNQYSPHNQMSLYSLAGKTILHSPIRGVIIDAAQIAVNFTRFERGITTRTQDQLDEWLMSALETINTIRHQTERYRDMVTANEKNPERAFPMNPTACGNYGGCPFREVCSRSPKVRESFLKSDYTNHNWDPLEAR